MNKNKKKIIYLYVYIYIYIFFNYYYSNIYENVFIFKNDFLILLYFYFFKNEK